MSSDEVTALVRAAPAVLAGDERPPSVAMVGGGSLCVVRLAVGDGRAPSRRATGQGASAWEALVAAARQLRSAGAMPSKPIVRLDVATGAAPVETVTLGLWRGYSPGLDGLSFPDAPGAILFPAEITAAGGETLLECLMPRAILDLLPATPQSQVLRASMTDLKPVRVQRFRVASAFTDGAAARPMCAGHRAVDFVRAPELAASLRAGTEALLRMCNADGSFLYVYNPPTGEKPRGYNMPRHGGMLWVMGDLYAWGRDERVLGALRRGLEWALAKTIPFGRAEDNASCVPEGRWVELGATALNALAAARYQIVTGDRRFEPQLRRLGAMLVLAQDRDGGFVHRYGLPGMEPDTEWECPYYPGEAILAMTHMARALNEPRWLAPAAKGARFLIAREQGKGPGQIPHDHWLLMALDELHAADGESEWVQYAERLATAIALAQNRAPLAAWRFGAFNNNSAVTAAACRGEALAAAWRLFQRASQPASAGQTLAALGLCAAFQLRMQHSIESVMDFRDPPFAIGMFPEAVGKPSVRIDYLQHNMSVLLALARIMESQKLATLPDPGSVEGRLLQQARQGPPGQ